MKWIPLLIVIAGASLLSGCESSTDENPTLARQNAAAKKAFKREVRDRMELSGMKVTKISVTDFDGVQDNGTMLSAVLTADVDASKDGGATVIGSMINMNKNPTSSRRWFADPADDFDIVPSD